MNKIQFYTGLAILLLLSVSLEGCKPDNTPPEAPKHHGPFYLGEARDYIFFKPGTWWVYENSKTKERDSIVLTIIGVDTIKYLSHQTPTTVTTERLWWKAKSMTNDYIYHFYLPHTPSPLVWDAQKYTENQWQFGMSKYKTGDFAGFKLNFSYPFDLLPTDNTGFIRLEEPDTLRLHNKLYPDIFAVEMNDTWFFKTRSQTKTRHYWARGYGIVKRQAINLYAPDTVSWELVNSSILQ